MRNVSLLQDRVYNIANCSEIKGYKGDIKVCKNFHENGNGD